MCRAPKVSDAGYTLLEVLVAIAIISLAVLSASTAYGLIVPSFQVRQFANDLANTARDLRRDAVRTQKVMSLIYVPDSRTVVSLDRQVTAPSGVDVSFSRTMDWLGTAENSVEFYPSGGSSGGVFEIARNGIRVEVTVDWVTGAVGVEQ